jgi:hypothetical protein
MHRKGHKARKTRKLRGGFYGAAGPIKGAPGAGMEWKSGSEMGPSVAGRGGNATYGGRRRKSRKSTKRRMRGGNKFGGVSASYQGTGTAGMADYKGIITRDGSGGAAKGAFNNYGAGPGSGFGSFIKTA